MLIPVGNISQRPSIECYAKEGLRCFMQNCHLITTQILLHRLCKTLKCTSVFVNALERTDDQIWDSFDDFTIIIMWEISQILKWVCVAKLLTGGVNVVH